MNNYNEITSKVIRLLQEYGYHKSTLNYVKCCYRNLEEELNRRGCAYSPLIADEWYDSLIGTLSADCIHMYPDVTAYRIRLSR